MSFTDHKITQFAHKIADLPDQPTLPPDELKSRFDACPEELRQSLNAVCDDAARLEARVEGIVVDTFGDTIDKEMLSDELQDELDAKATQTALDAEAAAREAADTAETAAREALAETVAQKCEVYFGSYTGNGTATRDIALGFRPKAVLVLYEGRVTFNYSMYGGLAMDGIPAHIDNDRIGIEVIDTGFRVRYVDDDSLYTNYNNGVYNYIAFR